MSEIFGNASLYIIASFAITLLFFLYQGRQLLALIPNTPEDITVNYVTPKNDDDSVAGSRVNQLREDLQNTRKLKMQIQIEIKSFVNRWIIIWIVYGIILFSLVVWSGEKSQSEIFQKLDKIERILLGKTKPGVPNAPGSND